MWRRTIRDQPICVSEPSLRFGDNLVIRISLGLHRALTSRAQSVSDTSSKLQAQIGNRILLSASKPVSYFYLVALVFSSSPVFLTSVSRRFRARRTGNDHEV